MEFWLCSSSCSSCGRAPDKQTDTVKVGHGLPPASAVEVKDGVPSPPPALQVAAAEVRRLAEVERQMHERLQALEESRLERIRQQKDDDERRSREEEEHRQKEVRLRQALARHEAEARAEEAARSEEKQRAFERSKLEERRRCQDEALKTTDVRIFLAALKLKGVNDKKKSGLLSRGFSYPLHLAVRDNNEKVVAALLWAGADPGLLDSRGLTPIALAQMLNKKDSHASLIDTLANARCR